ncbi:hypothetical protein [Oceanobacillus oncorhynchi]|uniref:hypothetical protein n=1 Tax=Oceanobacillus oncorhynchi TaxID=545501 RepID=UPI0034D56805
MIILIGLAILTVIGLIIIRYSSYISNWDTVGFFITMISGVLLAISLIVLPLNYYGTKAEVDRYNALQETIENSRSGDMSDIERAALTSEIADYNKDLASIKYWNNTIFDIYIYDGLAELEFLE